MAKIQDKQEKNIPIPLILVVIVVLIIVGSQLFKITPGESITILHTNDLQGQLIPVKDSHSDSNEELGGFSRLVSMIKQIKQTDKRVLVVDTGDTIQGTLFTKIYGGKDFGQLMSDAGYNAVTVGEHDFDKGPEGLREFIKFSTFPFIVSNIDVSSSDEIKGLISPSAILDISGIRVGMIGLITMDANTTAKIGTKIKITEPKEAAMKYISQLKPNSDVIIVLSHLGLEADRELAKSVDGINLIIGGHSKTKITEPVWVKTPNGKRTAIVQANNQGKYLGKVVLAVSKDNVALSEYNLLPVNSKIKYDETFETKIQELNKNLEKQANKVIGSTNVELNGLKSQVRTGETNLGNLFVDAVKDKFPESQIAMLNSGGIRGDKVFPKGNIKLADIWEWHPFENKIILVTITGKQLKEVLERSAASLPMSKGNFLQVSGLSFSIDLTEQAQKLSDDDATIKLQGTRVKDIKINNQPVDYNKHYRVAINDYMINGGDGYVTFKQASDIKNTNVSLTDILIDYVRKKSPLKVQTSNRIVIKGGLLR